MEGRRQLTTSLLNPLLALEQTQPLGQVPSAGACGAGEGGWGEAGGGGDEGNVMRAILFDFFFLNMSDQHLSSTSSFGQVSICKDICMNA